MSEVALDITAPAVDSKHSLTRVPVVGFANASHLQGGMTHDTLLLLNGGRLTGSWDGGEGTNGARVLLDPYAAVEVTDQQVWAISGVDAGGLGDRQTAFLATSVVNFDQKAVATDPTATDLELRKEIVLPNHRLVTGQAVVYQQLGALNSNIAPLLSNTIYYVIRIDSDKFKLAATPQDVSTGTAITPTKPTADGTYGLTPIDARTVNTFDQTKIDNGLHTINLHSHALATGQALRFRVQPGGNVPSTLNDDTTYYVVKVDAHTIKLASTPDEARQGVTRDITNAPGVGDYTLVAEVSLATKVFDGANVVQNAVRLVNHGLSTGQALVYRSGGTDAGKIAQLYEQ
jgi:hypothetical protein